MSVHQHACTSYLEIKGRDMADTLGRSTDKHLPLNSQHKFRKLDQIV